MIPFQVKNIKLSVNFFKKCRKYQKNRPKKSGSHFLYVIQLNYFFNVAHVLAP